MKFMKQSLSLLLTCCLVLATAPEGFAQADQPPVQAAPETPEQLQHEAMLDGIVSAMREGNYETAIIRWLQTGLHQEFFENYFADFTPDFIRGLNPLLLLSIGSAISGGIENKKMLERITWLEMILALLQAHVNAQDLVSARLLIATPVY